MDKMQETQNQKDSQEMNPALSSLDSRDGRSFLVSVQEEKDGEVVVDDLGEEGDCFREDFGSAAFFVAIDSEEMMKLVLCGRDSGGNDVDDEEDDLEVDEEGSLEILRLQHDVRMKQEGVMMLLLSVMKM